MSKFARTNIAKLKPYTPGEQPKAERKIIKLNTNENPYPPSPKVMKKLAKIKADSLRRYPEPQADSFRKSASEIFNIDPKMIITANGSDELLTIIFRTFVENNEIIAYPYPTYSLYPVLANIHRAKIIEVPFDKDYKLPRKLLKTKAKIIFIANPNAPTGTFIDPAEIYTFAKQSKSLIVIDEAYVDFAQTNCLELAKKLNNIIILRTLSKGYSLAGLRFGFAFANKSLISDMLKVKDSYNCDAISIALAIEAIKDQKYLKETVRKIQEQRKWLTNQLKTLGFSVLNSHANFLWASTNKLHANKIYSMLKQKGILIRYFDKPGLKNSVRITVGKPSENKILINTLKEILEALK